jgi:hypothetical protein
LPYQPRFRRWRYALIESACRTFGKLLQLPPIEDLKIRMRRGVEVRGTWLWRDRSFQLLGLGQTTAVTGGQIRVVVLTVETDQNRGRSPVRVPGDLSALPGADLRVCGGVRWSA